MDKLNSALEQRYKRLYGPISHRVRIKKVEKDLRNKLIIVCSLFLLLFLISISTKATTTNSIALDKKGNIAFLQRPQEGENSEQLNVKAVVQSKKGTLEKDVSITVEPMGEEEENQTIAATSETYEDKLKQGLQQAISSINVDRTSSKVYLPTKLETGETLVWSNVGSDSNLPLYFIGFVGAIFLIYKNRFRAVEKEEKEAIESIIRELPEFINKLVLLLNAGVVLNTAFQKIMEDRRSLNPSGNYFYNQMDYIYIKVKEANGSMHEELRSFSKRSGVRELMRFSNIINDNINKGAGLVKKLEQESELLWFSRKQQSEEKGRLAESKLTLPLMILLMVLIMVTIAPAMMEM